MIVINDRVKLAEALVKKGLIKSGDDHYREILKRSETRMAGHTTDEQIIEKAAYYKVDLIGAKKTK
jgi:hypothetical protein